MDDLSPHDAALWYAARGWACLPLWWAEEGAHGFICACPDAHLCTSPGKHPLSARGMALHGKDDATTDQETIARWWSRYPQANVGIATGASSGLVVLDDDPRNGGDESLAQLRASLPDALPETARSLTGGGGLHLVFRHPGGHLQNRAGADWGLPGLDVKADGGYICAPPSVHVSGQRYTWEIGFAPDEQPPAMLPDALVARLTNRVNGTGATKNGSQTLYARTHSPVEQAAVPEGARNVAIHAKASHFRRFDFPYEEARGAILAAAAACMPPLPEREALKALDSAYERYTPSERGPWLVAEPSTDERRPWESTITAAELDALTMPEPRQVIEGLISEGLTLLVGKPKIGKSWWILQACLAATQGRPAFSSQTTRQGSVLYLALEDNRRRLKKRIQKLLGSMPKPDNLYLHTEWPRVDQGGVAEIQAFLEAHPDTQLVVVDTLQKVRQTPGRNTQLYDEDARSVTGLKRLADLYGVAIVVVHHTRKMAADDWQDEISGTTGLTGAVDATIMLKRPRNTDHGTLSITGRDVEAEGVYALAWHDQTCTWEMRGDAEIEEMSRARKDIIRILQIDNEPQSPKFVAEQLDRSLGSTRLMLRQMDQAGEVRKTGYGMYMAVRTDAAKS